MGRRSDHTREELTELALTAGHDIVATKGLAALTARAVAERIGYSPGTIYSLFENFDELVLHVNARTLDRLYEQMAKVELGDDITANLEALLVCYFKFAEDHQRDWAAVLDYTVPGRVSLPPWYTPHVDQTIAILERAVAPEITANRRRSFALIAWASVHGLMVLANAGNLAAFGEPKPADLAHDMVRYLATGAAADEATSAR
ncbi:MAG: TetR/AcrR family transcriptional regulator [Pseudomonadota bacterium]